MEKSKNLNANDLYKNFIMKKYNKKAFIITVIGLDGSGKSTQIENIKELISANNFSIHMPVNKSLFPYKILFEKIASESCYDNRVELLGVDTDQLLMSIIKWNSMIEICKYINEENLFILMDRYTYCFLAAAKCRGVQNYDLINKMFEFFPMPDLTIFIDVSPSEALKRINKRGTDSMKLSFLEKHYLAYKNLPEAKNFVFIDGRGSVEEVKQRIYKQIKLHFPMIHI